MYQKLEGIKVELDSYSMVEHCILVNGIDAIKFVDWTKNTVEVLHKCGKCGGLIDKKYTHCLYCWENGACEDGENYEGEDY